MIYLDNAATTRYKPFGVKLAALKEIYRPANAGRGAHIAAIATAQRIEECRSVICKYFFDGNVIFTKNCTEALNLGLLGVAPKQQVITTIFEHNSVLRPLHRLSLSGKINLTLLSPNSSGSIEKALIAALKLPTSLVVLTAMSNVTGQTLPIDKLCAIIREYSDAYILVDMAQAAGHLKLNYQNIDMIATSGHKSLHGIQGSGFLLCKKNIRLQPILSGGTGTSSLSIDTPLEMPDGMEAGTLNSPAICALKEGIEWTFRNYDKINSKIARLSAALKEGLSSINGLTLYSCQNGLLLCNFVSRACSEVSDYLSAHHGICVRSGLHCAPLIHKHLGTSPLGAIRFSVGYNNTLTDIEKSVDAMLALSHKTFG